MSNFKLESKKLQTSHTICKTINCWNIWLLFKLHLALWILAQHKKNRKLALPPGSYNFSLNKIQLTLWTNQLNVV